MTDVDAARAARTHEPLTDQFMGVEFSIEDAPAFYADLRARGRLLWNATQGFWVAPHHAEVMAVSTDPATYCSGKGIITFEIGAEYASPPTMMHTDPPDHTRYRSLVQPAFGRRVVKTLDASVRDAARVLVDALPLDEPVDVVAPLAVPLPVQVIAQLLGLPEERWDDVWAWSEASIPGTEIYADAERRAALNAEMMAELLRLVGEARTSPKDDVISQLVGLEVDGDRLTDDEMTMFLNQLLVAGNETTRNTISGGLVALAQNPDQWARLVADRSLVPSAVEEILRWTTAVIYFMRTATRDVELGGQTVVAGDPIVMVYSSANLDEEEFGPTASTFDVGRSPNHHVAFGFGAHFCLGAALARLEVAAVLDALLDKGVTRLELAGPVVRSVSNIIAGTVSAPLILHTD
ncbi:MAG: cytochrome P450 [Acidimicrobiales bacterium]|jgi:cytochrome P450|nr:cytochrome P450 [Acidimicrobiales bacterium]